MAIIRAPRPPSTSTPIENETLQDARLSWVELGILCFLLSMKDYQEVSIKFLAGMRGAGKHVIRNALNNLEAAGYARKVQKHSEGGQFDGVDWHIYGHPEDVENLLKQCELPVDNNLSPKSKNQTTVPESKNQTSVQSLIPQQFQPKSNFPTSENRTPIYKKEKKEKSNSASDGCVKTVPLDFEPDAMTRQRCKQALCPEITSDHIQNFICHYEASGMVQANWQPKFVQWMLKAKSIEKTQTHQAAGKIAGGRKWMTDQEADRLGRLIKLEPNGNESYADYKKRLLEKATQEQIAQVMN